MSIYIRLINYKDNDIQKQVFLRVKIYMNKPTTNQNLFEQIINLIEQTKQNVAVALNSSINLMYWNIDKTINDEILKNQRVSYGKEIVLTLSQQLSWGQR